MKTKNNYIIRFNSRELAKDCFQYFPVKSTFSDGYTIIISGASVGEWEIYKEVIELLRLGKVNINIYDY